MKRTLSIAQPFRLEAVLKSHGWFQLPPFYWNDTEKTLHWIVRLQDDCNYIRVREIATDAKSTKLSLSGDSSIPQAQEDRIIAQLHRILNLDLDLSEFYAVCAKTPALQDVPALGMGRIMRSGSLFEDVFKSICGTNVQWRQAVKMVHNIAQLEESYPGTAFRAFPTPDVILKAEETFLRDTGRVGYRSNSLIEVCRTFECGIPHISHLESGAASTDELKSFFLSFKGIGKATAHYLLALYGHYGQLSVDSSVIAFMKKTHFQEKTPSEKEICAFYEPFGKWQFLAYWMEFITRGAWNPDE